MAERHRPPRRRFGSTSSDRLFRVNFILRNGFLGQKLLRGHGERYAVIPEPDEELEDSELSDAERREAIARERTRREGLT